MMNFKINLFDEFTLLLILAFLISGLVLAKAKGNFAKLALLIGLALYVSSFFHIRHPFFHVEKVPRAIGFAIILFGTFPNVKDSSAKRFLFFSLLFMGLTLLNNWQTLIDYTILKIGDLFR